jgi:benzoyl-CoA reductase/2-hydroxyglutaryl-CoA dehydratase subunit BcrC/BadD/HgdB
VSRNRPNGSKNPETLLLIIFVCDRVSVRYGKNVTDVDISECVTESVSVNSMDNSDGVNAPEAAYINRFFYISSSIARPNSCLKQKLRVHRVVQMLRKAHIDGLIVHQQCSCSIAQLKSCLKQKLKEQRVVQI